MMNDARRGTWSTVVVFSAIAALLVGAGCGVWAQQDRYSIVSWELNFEGMDIANPGLVFVQLLPNGWLINPEYRNTTGRDQNTIAIVLEGDYRGKMTWWYNGFCDHPFSDACKPSIVYDSVTKTTKFTYTGPNVVPPGGQVHIGLGVTNGSVVMLGAYWGSGEPAEQVPPFGLALIDGRLMLINGGEIPVIASSFRGAALDRQLPLEALNNVALEAQGISLFEIPSVGTIHIPPGGTQDTGIRIYVAGPRAPTLTQWGLIALGVLLAGSLAFMLRRRFRAQGSRA